MKTATKLLRSLLIGLFVLLATLAFNFNYASAGTPTGSPDTTYRISEQEISSLLNYYTLDDEWEVKNIALKFYTQNAELVFSAQGCLKELDCDERINHLVNQSDFITEVDNTRIYFITQ